jgi:6-phosphogluconolactonase
MRTSIPWIILMCFISPLKGQSSLTKQYNLIIGTYTNTGESEGIYVYNFNSRTGEAGYKSKVTGVENPTYLAISRDGKHLFSVNEVKKGWISSFAFNSISGELKFLNRVSSGGDGPCYVAVDDQNKYVFAGNYGSGSLSAVRLNRDGSLSADIQFIQLEGGSIDKNRQQGPHVHATVLSPDNRYLFTPNLGTDKVNIYRVDGSGISQPLIPAETAFIEVQAGSGPRHFTFHPNAKFAYLIHEMAGIISVFDYKNGTLISKQTITMLTPDFKGKVGAADIHISPDGKYLYGSNRGDANEIVFYSINKDGKLKYVGRQSTLGKVPRNFVIDPSGNFLLVANQNSNEVVIFKRDQKTGTLIFTGKKIQVGAPVCLKFVEAE